MVLMFLREFVEQTTMTQFQQTYGCPMLKCYEKFSQPFMLVQHLLSCPELPNGEFDCDKCQYWHEFPTNEKEWSQWTGWSGKAQRHHHQPGPDETIQRKRSFSTKVRDTFLRKKDSRKPSISMDGHPFTSSSRPGTAASATSSIMTMSRCPEHETMAFPSNGNNMTFTGLQKPTVSTGAPQIDNNFGWPSLGTDTISDLHSAVSSIAPSTFETDTRGTTSTRNTSRTTLFDTSMVGYPSSDVMTFPNMFTPPSAFDALPPNLVGHQTTEMSIDDPPSVTDPTMSPVDTATPNDATWWGVKQEIDTPRQTPVLSPYYAMDHAMDHSMMHPLSRTMSQESMQAPMSGLYQRALSEGTEVLSPHSEHAQHVHHAGGASMTGRASPTEELVCDECQWKPRGVRENLRGYLRKHKNTHKNIRTACDVGGCNKTFSRADNLKKHRKDKHGLDDSGGIVPLKRVAEEYAEHIEDEETESSNKRPAAMSEAEIRNASGDYSMLWPALHF